MHPRSPARAGALLLLVTCVSCNQGLGLPAPEDGPVGSIAERPDGSGQLYLVDPHQGGRAEELRLVETFWGRLVDVFDLDGGRSAPLVSYKLHRAWVSKYVAMPELNADNGGVGIRSVSLRHEGWERV